MDIQKQSIIDRIKQANNILVTVSKNPSIDQLAAALGFTLALNKLGKHAIAVFSGEVPSTMEFLKPEDTFEKNTDSLRDFIISLDKAKADKLRYKVEDQMVKIFITPYRTSLNDKDLEFSQGDFNVEVVVALGVNDPQDLDDAITAQGRILHDATVIDINVGGESKLGTLIWTNPKASSLCEMILALIEPMKSGLLDGQMSTAILTGIVAETERFSNEKTSPEAMQASSKLMAAGANQQLVATELAPPPPPEPEPEPEAILPAPVKESAPSEPEKADEPEVAPEEAEPEEQQSADGALEISHPEDQPVAEQPTILIEDTSEKYEEQEQEVSQIIIDEQGKILAEGEELPKAPSQTPSRGLTLQPPTLGGQLTANSEPEHLDPSIDIIGEGAEAPTTPMLSHQTVAPTMPEKTPADDARQTLANLEEAVHSPHLANAQGAAPEAMPDPSVMPEETMPNPITTNPGLPKDQTATTVIDPVAPPPVPPPMMPPNFVPPTDETNNSL